VGYQMFALKPHIRQTLRLRGPILHHPQTIRQLRFSSIPTITGVSEDIALL